MITAANARELQQRSVQARLAAKLAPEPEPQLATEPVQVADDYTAKILARVRVQLNLVHSALTTALEADEPDAAAIDRLASAQMRLAEQERILAGRPLPGSRKPLPERSIKRTISPAQPIEAQPAQPDSPSI